jgi:hypothetical protein
VAVEAKLQDRRGVPHLTKPIGMKTQWFTLATYIKLGIGYFFTPGEQTEVLETRIPRRHTCMPQEPSLILIYKDAGALLHLTSGSFPFLRKYGKYQFAMIKSWKRSECASKVHQLRGSNQPPHNSNSYRITLALAWFHVFEWASDPLCISSSKSIPDRKIEPDQ